MTKREQELAFHFFQVQSPVKSAPLLVLDLGLDVVDGVGRLHLKGDGLPRKGLDEDLHLHERSTSRIVCLGTAALTVA